MGRTCAQGVRKHKTWGAIACNGLQLAAGISAESCLWILFDCALIRDAGSPMLLTLTPSAVTAMGAPDHPWATHGHFTSTTPTLLLALLHTPPLRACCTCLQLGKGGQGQVWRGLYQGREVAIKLINDDDESSLLDLQTELQFLARLNHDNVVRVLGGCMRPPNLCVVQVSWRGIGCCQFHQWTVPTRLAIARSVACCL